MDTCQEAHEMDIYNIDVYNCSSGSISHSSDNTLENVLKDNQLEAAIRKHVYITSDQVKFSSHSLKYNVKNGFCISFLLALVL